MTDIRRSFLEPQHASQLKVASRVPSFVFQPLEEWGHGINAKINNGLGKDISFDEIYGLHNMPGLPIGEFQVRIA